MKYKFTAILMIISETVFATSNVNLFSASGRNCADLERFIFGGTSYRSFYDQIYNCLDGNTYSYNSHWIRNLVANSGETIPRSLEKDGDRYQLQYFPNIESMNQRIELFNYNKQLSDYNACNLSNTEKSKTYSLNQAKYAIDYSNYQAQLAMYKTSNSNYQNKLQKAKKIESELDKYAYIVCMSGGLVNGYGVPVQKFACKAYAQVYVVTDLIPEYNYKHNNILEILNTSPEKPPVEPNKPQDLQMWELTNIQMCGVKPVQSINIKESDKNSSSPILNNKIIQPIDN